MANSDTRRSGNRRRPRGNRPPAQQEGLLPVLAKAVRDVENAVQRGRVTASTRSSFQAIGLLVREERARAKTDPDLTEAQQKKLDDAAMAKGLTTGPKASIEFRQFINAHTDTISAGPMTASELYDKVK